MSASSVRRWVYMLCVSTVYRRCRWFCCDFDIVCDGLVSYNVFQNVSLMRKPTDQLPCRHGQCHFLKCFPYLQVSNMAILYLMHTNSGSQSRKQKRHQQHKNVYFVYRSSTPCSDQSFVTPVVDRCTYDSIQYVILIKFCIIVEIF